MRIASTGCFFVALLLVCVASRAQAQCPGAVLGDPVIGLSDLAGSTIADPSELLRRDPRWVWVEDARVVRSPFTLVALEKPGDDAALVVLSRGRADRWCVRAVWGFSFGGLGVEPTIADVHMYQADSVLVVLEALATYNNPADDPSDPYEPRRIVLYLDATSAGILLDTHDAALTRYARHHFYLDQTPTSLDVVAVSRRGSRRWRFDPAAHRLSRHR